MTYKTGIHDYTSTWNLVSYSSLRQSARPKPAASAWLHRDAGNNSTTSNGIKGQGSSKEEKDKNDSNALGDALWLIPAAICLHYRYKISKAREQEQELENFLSDSVRFLLTKAVDPRDIDFDDY
ncbi:hypothetical protein Moror_4557 [Moniliophthora roreri MCA 2997]|uniref:Uncharacterized protein n=1 Tax=Moniliophthora roreri (strain MCA 2997) TaxID=1381753 RepID=V2XIP3_MONRO|nr:hypothetical protein Moror_4557 [Moniliophthora roreri MCA 2997]